jgi:alkaline phosphatase D
MKKKLTAILCMLLTIGSYAQYITHGPVFGAVKADGAKVYIRTTKPLQNIELALSTNKGMANPIDFTGITNQQRDNSLMLQLTGLKPDTRYYYTVKVDGKPDTITGNFRTFPEVGKAGDYVFVTGSCQETENMKVFNAIPLNDPYFLMHTGDYTYPDYQIKRDYANSMDTIALSYRKRYDEKVMKQMLYNVPIDYVYDDDDYVGASGGRYCTNDCKMYMKDGKVVNEMSADTFPAMWRRHVIRGYDEYFPHYDLPDTSEGIYHSFKMGNAEFFVIDRNSAKDFPHKDLFTYNKKKRRWEFAPPPGYALFGKKQMDWLKEGIKNSTADWKFIVSGVPLNGACKKLIDGGLKIQKMHWKGWFGFHMASGFGQYWAGYPEERDDFMKFVTDNNIKNLVVISGDTHHSVMDDGTNAGLPEMNSSGLSVSTTELAKYLKLIGNLTSAYKFKKVWNKGGIGISEKTCKNGFGKIRIVGKEYVEMSIVDEDNKVVSTMQVPYKK